MPGRCSRGSRSSTSRGASRARWRPCCSRTTAPRSRASSRPAAIRSAPQLGYRTWQRGKRSAVLDLKTPADRDCLLALARGADVLVESYAPGVTARLGIDYATAAAAKPAAHLLLDHRRMGAATAHSDRPGYDALVAARTGLHFEQRGWPEGAINHMGRRPDPFAELEIPLGVGAGPAAPGPGFPCVALAEPRRVLRRHARPSAPRCARARSRAAGNGSRPRCCRARWSAAAASGSARRNPKRRCSTAGSSAAARPRGTSSARTAAGSTTGCRTRASSSPRPRASR